MIDPYTLGNVPRLNTSLLPSSDLNRMSIRLGERAKAEREEWCVNPDCPQCKDRPR